MAKLRLGPAPVAPPRRPLTPRDTRPTLFEQLLACMWQGIIIPVTSLEVSFEHDLVQHKYWGVDGADVEATGRAPMTLKAVIPFVNGIAPGKTEEWDVLYPIQFRLFLKEFAKRESGYFQHPELGFIFCKPHTLTFSHEAQRRDGVEVTATWIETNDPGLELGLNTDSSPVANGAVAAVDLDASAADIRGLAPDAPVFEESFESLMNKITGVVDSATINGNLLANKPAQLKSRVTRLQASLERARTPLAWGAIEACEKIKAAVAVASTIISGRRKVLRYTTPARMTMAGMLSALPGSNIDDLILLNPSLLSRPEVAAGSVVRYYA